jgi:hypothetical protein
MPSLTYWQPIVLLIVLLVLLGIAYAFRSRGEKGYKEGTRQADVFLSGERPPESVDRHVRAKNIYWGFFEGLKRYYGPALRAHTGIVNDYVIWFAVLIAVTAIVALVT